MKKIILIMVGLIVAGCIVLGVMWSRYKGESMSEQGTPLKTFSDLTETQLQQIAQKRVYFGHQSVGFNLTKGLEELKEKHASLNLKVMESSDLKEHDGPVFAHSRIGKNKKPKSKVDDFVKFIESGLSEKIDVAFCKFCYADILPNTNIQNVFDYYKKSLGDLKAKYPNVKFIHCTVPYFRATPGFKGFLKSVLGKDKNTKRNRFNDLLLAEYPAADIFDLGQFESTHPDGKREKSGKNVYALVSAYTKDGGHLNEKGRELMATQLLHYLSQL
ncbi:MAG: hypothetical protein GY765_43535 [bacterium]|nr:hypothetical protein [bacterium]